MFAHSDRADARVLAEKLCAVEAGDLDRFDGSKTRLDQQLDFAQVAEAGDDAAVAGRIEAGD